MKTCSTCKQTKPIDDFALFRRAPDGRQYNCRPCQSEKANAWNKAHPERCRVGNRNARARNPERTRANERRRHERNRAARIAAMTDYARRHPQKAALRNATRRALLASAIGSHTEQEREELMASYGGRCVYCAKPAKDIDHVTPLARGGCNHIGNLAPACMRCNRSKGASTLIEFLMRKAA